jgi:predicted porin
LAALAAFGSASAEVTLYGKVDLGLSSTTTTGGVDQGLEVTSGNYEGSRLGVKGGSDLGAGVKAIFQYEMGLNAANYATAITTDRVAMVGLTGSFGTVGLGLQWTPYDNAWSWDQTEYNGFSAPNRAWYKGAHGDNGNTGNGNAKKSISYTTPNLSGFDATVMYANAADATATDSATKYIGVGANYNAGPLGVNFAWESTPSSLQIGALASQADKTSAWILGASYDLGVAKIGVGVEQATVDAGGGTGQAKDSGYTLTAGFPVSKQTTLAASYASETTTSAGVTDGTAKSFGGQVIYNWTTQAAIYAGAYQVKSTDLGLTTEVTKTKYAAGIRYNF